MKLYTSTRSPFVRKVLVAAHETGLASRIETIAATVAITGPNPVVMAANPLNKIPTLVLDDGQAVYDSLVICAYFDSLQDGFRLIPTGAAGLETLRRHALADGLLDLLILWRDERAREPPSQAHLAAYDAKTRAVLDRLEDEVAAIEATPFDLAHITLGCLLGYIDFRFGDLGWRQGRPRLTAFDAAFAKRPSAQATVPEL